MENILNLDEFEKNSKLILKGICYEIPPISYTLAEKFMKVTQKTELKDMVVLLVEYMNTNLNKLTVNTKDLQSLSMKQITKLMEYVVNEVVGIEKN